MEVPSAPPRQIRPTLAVLLAIFVGLFSLAFGLGALYDHEATLAPAVRVLMPLSLLVAPTLVAVQVRRLGVWMSVTAWALASGAVLVVCAPIAMINGGFLGALVLVAGMTTMLIVGAVVARGSRHRPTPPRVDRAS
jgi:O-antigen/teichoic acid export membrane protein